MIDLAIIQTTIEPSLVISLVNTGLLGLGIKAAMRWQTVLSEQREMAKDIRDLRDHVARQNGRIGVAERTLARVEERHNLEDRRG